MHSQDGSGPRQLDIARSEGLFEFETSPEFSTDILVFSHVFEQAIGQCHLICYDMGGVLGCILFVAFVSLPGLFNASGVCGRSQHPSDLSRVNFTVRLPRYATDLLYQLPSVTHEIRDGDGNERGIVDALHELVLVYPELCIGPRSQRSGY